MSSARDPPPGDAMLSGDSGVREGAPRASAEITARFVMETMAPASSADERAPADAAIAGDVIGDRYEDLRLLGSGGFGDVRRVLDRKLGRVVAMKILHPEASARAAARARFLAEIKLTAGLQHPGIVAVHDYGELPDGRLWYTMPEIRGRTLRAVIDDAFRAPADEASLPGRRLLGLFARACEAVAYAHSRGVIHRDLKPENIMVGEFGQVMIMDWGLARSAAEGAAAEPAEQPASFARDPEDAWLTREGDVLGTPAYMAPEQERGEIHRHGPATDVYALGAILHHLLAGSPPRGGACALPPGVADEIAAVCARAMAHEPGQRHADAGELAAEISTFLHGARRRERALAELEKVASLRDEIARLHARAGELRADARRLLEPVRPFDPVAAKLPGWEREDEAERLDREGGVLLTRWFQGVHGALTLDPDLADTHGALADHYQARLLEAERDRREAEAASLEVLLAAHDRGRYAPLLRGLGALSLRTDPEGAEVTLHRYAIRERRLVPEPVRALGRTPLVEIPLPRGSYLLTITAPGRAEVRYPVLIERGGHWHGCPPGAGEPFAVPLPAAREIAPSEVYVPAGWAFTGGDPEAPDSLPRRLVWIDGFIAGRFPVTNEEYLAFLDDLVAGGREDEALAACPRANLGTVAGSGEQLAYDRDARGRFRLKEHDPGQRWTLRSPAVLMSWHGAIAFARRRAARTGQPYRLLAELEREKAARGTDGRHYPWGNHFDPTWACMLSSHRGQPSRVDVDAYPLDESPYGLRGGAGNSRDFCLDVWTPEGPPLVDGRLVVAAPPEDGDAYRSVRGGAWSSVENHCRAAARFVLRPREQRSAIGLRLARSYP